MNAPVSFNAFVVSLATMAAVHFGDVTDPQSGEMKAPDPRRRRAGHRDAGPAGGKRRGGNLTDDEERFMTRVLEELRRRYRNARNGAGTQ